MHNFLKPTITVNTTFPNGEEEEEEVPIPDTVEGEPVDDAGFSRKVTCRHFCLKTYFEGKHQPYCYSCQKHVTTNLSRVIGPIDHFCVEFQSKTVTLDQISHVNQCTCQDCPTMDGDNKI